MKDAILIDIDGTLAIRNGIREPFDFNNVYLDKINKPLIKILELLLANHEQKNLQIIYLSGRPDSCEEETLRWLKDKISFYNSEHILLMRITNDFRQDYIVKKEIYEQQIKDKYNVLAIFDDRNQVVNMWREQNLLCLQVAEGNF